MKTVWRPVIIGRNERYRELNSAEVISGARTRTRLPEVWCAVSLVGLCFVGYLKGGPFLTWMPVDPTAFFAACCLGGLIAFYRQTGTLLTAFMRPSFLLWLAFIPGVAIAIQEGFDLTKVGYLFSTTLLCVLLPPIIGLSFAAQRTWLYGIAATGVGIGIGSILFPDTHSLASLRLNLDGGSTVSTARALGAVAVLMFAFAMAPARRQLARLVYLAVATGSLILMLLIGSKGPFLSVAVATAVLIGSGRLSIRARVAAIMGVAVSVILLVTYIADNRTMGSSRIVSFLTGDATDSARSHLYQVALTESSVNPLGVGWSGFSDLHGAYGFAYPHNMLLEILVEAGWLAGIAFALYAIAAIVRLHRTSTTAYGLAFYGLAVYWLSSAQFSSDINGNRITWAALAFGFAALQVNEQGDRVCKKAVTPVA